jgi:hypothetical protein
MQAISDIAWVKEVFVTARKLKPTIPIVGDDGIPLRDELELEKLF